jgi:hypothetical protein
MQYFIPEHWGWQIRLGISVCTVLYAFSKTDVAECIRGEGVSRWSWLGREIQIRMAARPSKVPCHHTLPLRVPSSGGRQSRPSAGTWQGRNTGRWLILLAQLEGACGRLAD